MRGQSTASQFNRNFSWATDGPSGTIPEIEGNLKPSTPYKRSRSLAGDVGKNYDSEKVEGLEAVWKCMRVWLVVWNMFFFDILSYIGNIHPN